MSLKKVEYKNVILIHDSMTKTYEQHFPKYCRKYMDAIIPACVKRSDAIITVFECARQDIIKHLNAPPEKTHYKYF